ncbi:MAG TPA: hypothetical protein VK475_12005 [Pyrinomonadaceae bacterium]|nr:hypothetical protein [Pyrinomonadaceae bacterium]
MTAPSLSQITQIQINSWQLHTILLHCFFMNLGNLRNLWICMTRGEISTGGSLATTQLLMFDQF